MLEDHVLRTDLTDHRGTDDARLLSALADGDAIALAEAYHRTITAAHACARRLLASPVEIEALMRAVYTDLWEEPPTDTALEGWVRARCFNIGAGYLRQRNLRAPSPSLAAFTSGIEADGHGVNDSLEQIISELTEQQQAALVRAHDQGIRTAEQDDAEAGWSLLHALLMLASPLTDDERHAAEMCSSGVALANWTFGLLPPHEASTVPGTAAEPTPCGRLAGVLRRARRRFEPLPPTPDLGHRVLASVLSNGAARQPAQARESSLTSDLRVAYADLGRSRPTGDEPTSSLDMTVPAPVAQPQPVAGDPQGLPGENGRRASYGWDTGDQEQPTALRPAVPPGLPAAGPPPAPAGNAAPALTPLPSPDPDEPASEDLVRMPLRRIGPRPSTLPPPHDADQATEPLPPGDPSILGAGRPPVDAGRPPIDSDATLPPTGLRERRSDLRSEPPPRGLRGPEPDRGPAPSPLGAGEQRPRPDRDALADSPLRRPAPQARGFDSQQRRPPPPRALDASARPALRRDDSDPRMDDVFSRSDPRLGDAFGNSGPRMSGPFDDDDATIPPSSGAGTATTAAMPPVRRREAPPSGPNRLSAGPAASAPPPPPAPAPGPPPSMETESTGGGASLLRWVIVVVLVALGAAFGIWLGQMLIT
jgi:DNA-directed RNA polymerase specialized sigma24 family protein